MEHGGRRRHTAARVHTPGNKAHNNQLTSYDGSTLLKLEKKLLLVILLLMHVASTTTSDDDDAATATRQWAPCSPLDDIANSDAVGMLPTIYSTRAGGGGEGGRGLRMSNVVTTQEKMGTLGL